MLASGSFDNCEYSSHTVPGPQFQGFFNVDVFMVLGRGVQKNRYSRRKYWKGGSIEYTFSKTTFSEFIFLCVQVNLLPNLCCILVAEIRRKNCLLREICPTSIVLR